MDLCTANTIMEQFEISRATFFRYQKEGMPFKKVGKVKLYDPDEVAEYIAQKKNTTSEMAKVGNVYTNTQICEMFRVGVMGAIRKSNTKKSIVVIAYPNAQRFVYHDYWKEDVLYFYGQGSVGDQSLSVGYNRALYEARENGFKIYLFESPKAGQYMYRGVAELVETAYMEQQEDMDGNMRNVWVFPLKLVNENDYISKEMFDEETSETEKEMEEFTDEEVEDFAVNQITPIAVRKVVTNVVQRNPYVARYAKVRASGKCELCGEDAPFKVEGVPYLEVTHLVPMSQGGLDVIENVAAVCPNCHRRLHVLKLESDIEILRNRIEEDARRLQKRTDSKDE